MDALKQLTAKLQHHTLNDLLTQAADDEMAAQDRDSGTESIEDSSSIHGASYSDDVTLVGEAIIHPSVATAARQQSYHLSQHQHALFPLYPHTFLPVTLAPIPATTAAADGGDNPAMPERSETGMRAGDAVKFSREKHLGDSRLGAMNGDIHAVDSSEEELALINGASMSKSSSNGSCSMSAPPRATPEGGSWPGGLGEKRKWRETQDEGCCCCGSGEGVQRADCCYSGSSASDEEVSSLLAAIHHQAPRGLPSSSASPALYPFYFSSCSSSSSLAAEDASYGLQRLQSAAPFADAATHHSPSASLAADRRQQQQQIGDTLLGQDQKNCWQQDAGEAEAEHGSCGEQQQQPQGVRSTTCPHAHASSCNALPLPDSCPRKRHCLVSSGDKRHNAGLQRPCLDFEKMQRLLLHRRHCTGLGYSSSSSSGGGSRARIVKVKTFSGSPAAGSFLCDPSTFAFQSIGMTFNTLVAPVEETHAR